MIRTKEAQILDAKTGKTDIVYMSLLNEVKDHATKEIKFYIILSTKSPEKDKDGNDIYNQVGEVSVGKYKEAIFLGLFGELTLNEFKAQEDDLLINQIEYANSLPLEGNEDVQRFWSLIASDMEKVIV